MDKLPGRQQLLSRATGDRPDDKQSSGRKPVTSAHISHEFAPKQLKCTGVMLCSGRIIGTLLMLVGLSRMRDLREPILHTMT